MLTTIPLGLEHIMNNDPEILVGEPYFNGTRVPLETVVDNLYSRRESLGVNYVTVQQSQIESFAPVVERLRGR